MKLESEVCDLFAAHCEQHDCIVYPEFHGWDLLVVHGIMQLGIEAKLKASPSVAMGAFCDAIKRCYYGAPHYIGILLGDKPSWQTCFVGQELGIEVFYPPFRQSQYIGVIPSHLPLRGKGYVLPKYRLQGSGGQPSPRVLSAWRINALRLAAKMIDLHYLTSKDFRNMPSMRQVWGNRLWLTEHGKIPDMENGGRKIRLYTKGPRFDNDGPHIGYEKEMNQITGKDEINNI